MRLEGWPHRRWPPHPSRRRLRRLLRACDALLDDLRCIAMTRLIPLSQRFGGSAMGGEELFPDLPVDRKTEALGAGAPRLREPVRDQVELRPVDLDALIAPDHIARVIWDYVCRLDLSALENQVRARTHTPGQAPASPRLMLALWLYAASQGVGSARALAKLCESHD